MITMVAKQTILHLYRVLSYSKRQISRELKLNRKTVQKIILEYEFALLSDSSLNSVEKVMLSPPAYDSGKRVRRVMTDDVVDIINLSLKDNLSKRACGLHKQCMLKQDIYELLLSKGFNLSYASVCKYITKLEKDRIYRLNPAFIRQHYNPGEVCEFDWGEVKLYIKGKLHKFNMAVFTLAHSNGRYAYLFTHQDTLAFMESHNNFFRDINGVPQIMVYDNMRVAIKKFVGCDKHPTDALMRMSTFNCFSFRFCNARAGWEKGHVERSVDVVRRKAFGFKYRFPTLDEAEQYLGDICKELNSSEGSISTANKRENLKADLASIGSYVGEMGCFEISNYKVDKWATICMKKVHYSVPDNLVGKVVSVKIYSQKIILYYNDIEIASHPRIYSYGKWSIKLEHYIETLTKKPGAVASSVALKQMQQRIQHLFSHNFTDNPKEFVLLIHYALENGFNDNDIIESYDRLKGNGINKPSADQIKVLLHTNNEHIELQQVEIKTQEYTQIEVNSMNTLYDLSKMMDKRVSNNLNT